MTIQGCHQIQFDKLRDLCIDLLICSSGFEKRATHFARLIDHSKITKKVVLFFNDRTTELSREENDNYFKVNNFEIIHSDGDLEEEVTKVISDFLLRSQIKEINILVDYSCMTRIWYGGILKSLKFGQYSNMNVKVLFSYTIAKYVKPSEIPTYNIHIGPIRGFTSLSIPQKPTALIICLGYEKNRAIGLYEYFDGETFLFYSNSDRDSQYSKDVKVNNAEMIEMTKAQNRYEYPINDMDYTNEMLSSLCMDLSKDYRVIIAPCGPKPFTLLSLITALRFENVDAWRISSGKESIPVEKEAEGEVVIYEVEFYG